MLNNPSEVSILPPADERRLSTNINETQASFTQQYETPFVTQKPTAKNPLVQEEPATGDETNTNVSVSGTHQETYEQLSCDTMVITLRLRRRQWKTSIKIKETSIKKHSHCVKV